MYKLVFSSQALDFYNKLYYSDRGHFQRVDRALEALKTSPFIGKSLKQNLKGMYSLRVGMYRIVYEVSKAKITVFVLRIGHRREVYQ